jgi:hypothetical protein
MKNTQKNLISIICILFALSLSGCVTSYSQQSQKKSPVPNNEKITKKSTPLPTYKIYSPEEMAVYLQEKYDTELEQWTNIQPELIEEQILQIIAPNNELKAYEMILINLGKITRLECLSNLEEYTRKMNPEISHYTAMQCMTSPNRFRERKRDDLELINAGIFQGRFSNISYGAGLGNLEKCHNRLETSRPKSSNRFKANNKYNLSESGCLLNSLQSIPNPLVTREPKSKRKQKKPYLNTMNQPNAKISGGIVCMDIGGAVKAVLNPNSENNLTLENVGTIRNGGRFHYSQDKIGLANCFKLEKGALVNASKHTTWANPKIYKLSFSIMHENKPIKMYVISSIDNLEFIPKKSKSLNNKNLFQ